MHARGETNGGLVVPQNVEVVLDHYTIAPHSLRYFTACTAPDGLIWFLARSGHTYNDGGYSTWLVRANPVLPAVKVLADNSISHNAVIVIEGGVVYVFGGQDFSDFPRDGIKFLSAPTFDDLKRGFLLGQRGNTILKGDHKGCSTARHENGRCEFDGLISAVHIRGRWFIFVRENRGFHGGRHVQVASAKMPTGPYGAFQSINVDGYDKDGRGNIYFFAVCQHPDRSDIILALAPINLGTRGEPNGNGEALIAISFTCDGVNWSRLVPLVYSLGVDGRTYDQPSGGVFKDGNNYAFYVQENVPFIASDWQRQTRLVKYKLSEMEFLTETERSRSQLPGCSAPSRETTLDTQPSAPPPPPLKPYIYKSSGYYGPAKGCDIALNAYCSSSCSPLISGVETIARFGAGPRWIDLHAWRCYSLSVLDDDTLHYRGGTLLCSRHTELVSVLQKCRQWSPPPPFPMLPPLPPPMPPPMLPPMLPASLPPMLPPSLPPRPPPLEPSPPPPSTPTPPPLLPVLPQLSVLHQPGLTPRDVGVGWALILFPLFVTMGIVAYYRLGLHDRLKMWWNRRRRRLPESEVEIIVAEASKHMATASD